ncbi:protein FAM200C-like [Parasteatoda tepidariorum]|uniref:protein FAM200C-like n=1 Tax=Parasteatoda tepidariorum TaxID=114398 RepID=UPI0039BD468C
MSEDIEKQHVKKMKTTKFSVQMDESTWIDSVAVLITYVRYIDKRHFAEEMLFYGAPKKNGFLKLMKDENPEMTLVHCVIRRENLVARNILPVLNEVLHSVIKCINDIKANAKCELLFKLFCEEQNADYVRLLLHTEVRWLSKGNCLKIFMELFDVLNDFLSDKPKMKYLLTVDDKAFFHWLQKCEVNNTALLVIVDYLKILSADLEERFIDLKQIDFPTWMMQPKLVDLTDISNMQYQEELAEMQNDESVKTLFNIKVVMAWLCEETEIKYPNSTKCARKLLLPFPSSYLAEFGFSVVL